MKTKNILFIIYFCTALCAISFLACKEYPLNEPPCPVVIEPNPKIAPMNTVVTVIGENFRTGKPEQHILKIGDTIVSVLDVPDDKTLRFKVPQGLKSGVVSVTLNPDMFKPEDCTDGKNNPMFTYEYTATVGPFAGTLNTTNCATCLNNPVGLDVDKDGNLWVTNESSPSLVKKFDVNGNMIYDAGGGNNGVNKVCNDIIFTNPKAIWFSQLSDVAAQSDGNTLVLDKGYSVIRKIRADGSIEKYMGVCTESTPKDGACNVAQFGSPRSVVEDGAGVIYLIDAGNLKKIAHNGNNCAVTPFVDKGGALKNGEAIAINRLWQGFGPIFITDPTATKKIKSVSDAKQVTDLPLKNEPFNQPVAIVADKQGNLFVADKANNQIYIIYTNGSVISLAGNGQPGSADGVGTIAQFNKPSGLAYDAARNILYVSDNGNQLIRKITFQ